MKATIEFDLNDTDDSMSHLRFVKALDLALCIWEILQVKKSVERLIEGETLKGDFEVLDEVFKQIYEKLEDNDINIDKLIV